MIKMQKEKEQLEKKTKDDCYKKNLTIFERVLSGLSWWCS